MHLKRKEKGFPLYCEYRLAFHATFVVVAGLRVKLTQAEIKAKTVVERSY